MKIKNLQLKNFKRFTDLTLQEIPADAKLVLLIGSNGSGKSSVFDAFEVINKVLKSGKDVFVDEENYEYYKKDASQQFSIHFYADNDDKEQYVTNNGGYVVKTGNSFYGRSAVRYFPRLERAVIGMPINVGNDDDRPGFYIDRDNRFENDIDLLLSEIVKKVFSDLNNKTNGKIDEVKMFMERINASLSRIFNPNNYSQLQLKNFQTPADGNPAQLIFKKGIAEINYDLLSAGEKEIINLLINLYTRARHFSDTIYFFDEIDAHLNTKLQYYLLKEITENWIPENCQFWTASHSLGFIQYAKDTKEAVIFDFDDYDFDYHKVLTPEPKDNPELYEIAVHKELLPALFKDFKIYFVENKDKSYYSAINIPHALFVQSNNKKSVYHKAKNSEFYGIIDRDFLTDNDIGEIEMHYPKLKILRLYSIENYLYHPNNLNEYYFSKGINFDETSYRNAIIKEKEIAKAGIIRSLALNRTTYPFFEEPQYDGKANQKRFKNDRENLAQVATIEEDLNSNDFDTFYKLFPMKENAKHLKERQNISKSDLSKTVWFKTQMEKIIS